MTICLEKPSTEQANKIEKLSRMMAAETEKVGHNNQAEFKRLEDEDKRLAGLYSSALAGGTATLFVPNPLLMMGSLVVGSVSSRLILTRSKKIHSVLGNARAIDETFRDRSPEISCDLEVPDQGRLDLFVRFPVPPQKVTFAIALRSHGKSKVYYSEEKEALHLRTRGGWKPWKPDHIERLALQESWLRRNRQEELFGASSKDRNRAVIKLLVLTGETRLGQHSDALYSQIGDQKVLSLKRRSSILVLEEPQLIPLIQAWFASMR